MTDDTARYDKDSKRSADPQLVQGRANEQHEDAKKRGRSVVICATFTADLLREPLQFWLDRLEIANNIVLAPYAQVLQELWNPQSLPSQNDGSGFNVLLVRPEDWIRDRQQESVEDNLVHIRRSMQEFLEALRAMLGRTSAATLVVLCPPSSRIRGSYLQLLLELQAELERSLAEERGVHCWTHQELMQLYPVRDHEDASADRIGHIPYTSEYFAAIATILARRIVAQVKPPYKVIAVDCDNTLWKGVCGEDGPAGIEFTDGNLALQRLLLRQYEAGVLLCLCTKNNPADVEAVFKLRSEMVLRLEHFVAMRVNWEAKSTNLQALAQELDLGLDSFMLIDDSSMECEEVRMHCRGVLTLQFPQTPDAVTHFLNHIWVFDRVGVTAEARQRTDQYQKNRARSKALEDASSFEEFLASLELKIEIAPMQTEHLARAAELTIRTNQFNFTTVRRTAGEIEALSRTGELDSRVVHVRDRFGDYGLVGLMLFRRSSEQIEVDTFLLSCRVLGRGVEHRIVNELGRIARNEGRTNIVLRYRHTARSAPAWAFMDKAFGGFRTTASSNGQVSSDAVFVVPAVYAEKLSIDPAAEKSISEGKASYAPSRIGSEPQWHELVYGLTHVEDIVREIRRSARGLEGATAEYVAPSTPTEAAVADICAQVLSCTRIGALDNFFELGGDSVKAVQVVSRISSKLGLEVPLHEFFEQATVQNLARRLAVASASGPIQRTLREELVPLSSAQQRLWFIDQLEGGSTAYHIPLAMRLRGELNELALQGALNTLLKRHNALRTTFLKIDGQPVQRVNPPEQFVLDRIDLRGHDREHREEQLRRLSLQDLAAPFSLISGPLIRGKLLKLDEDEHVLLITMHHIVSDGWSIGVLIRELGLLYEAFRVGKSDPQPPLPLQYTDYAEWQHEWLKSTGLQDKLAYWLESLRGAPQLLALPTDRPRPMVQSYRGSSVQVSMDAKFTARLNAFSRRHHLTLAMTLFAAWSLLLSRLSGQADVVIGMPVANRRRTELEDLIGFFVNTLAIRIQIDDDATITQLLERARQVMIGAYSHQDVPFERVVEVLQPVRSLSHSAVFQVMFVLQNAPRDPVRLAGLSIAEEQVASATAQFDLSLALQQVPDGIIGCLTYASDLFNRATIERWAKYFMIVVQQIVEQPQARIRDLRFLPADEHYLIVESFNSTQVSYPRDETISRLFEQQVARTPDAVACVYGAERWSYRQLNGRANRLARHLAKRGAKPGDYIPVLMVRSAQMLVAQLAIAKLGAVYVPVDPELPDERRQFMIRDCRPGMLIASSESHRKDAHGIDYIDISQEWHAIEVQSETNLDQSVHAAAPAYVMYTSGSTGLPKGVVVPHRAISRTVINNSMVRIGVVDAIAHYSSPVFDASTLEVWGALLNGANVVVVPPGVALEPHSFGDLLKKECVTILYMSVGLFNQNADIMSNVFLRLQYLIVGGDVLDPLTIRRVLQNSPPSRLLNGYGPTECTTFSTSFRIGAIADGANNIPIGKPNSNTQVFILNHRLDPVPIGVCGEIYIGGDGVACGYLNRPNLTAERFISNPFNRDGAERLYKTGDLGRWRADGAIEYLGRNDYQVKIRGFRVELGDIEAQLARHPAVAAATVLARQDVPGEKRLVAYIVANRMTSVPSGDELRAHLKNLLPEYMVPSVFVLLERLPLTSTGKVNRHALPAPQLTADSVRDYEAPVGEAERNLANVWEKLLQIGPIGRNDNFFELGGHSLLAMQLTARLQSSISEQITVRLIFECPVLKDMAARIFHLRATALVDRLETGGADLQQLLEKVAAMPEKEARDLLDGLLAEGRS